MKARSAAILTRKGAAVAIAAVAVVHLVLAREYLEEATYLGVLFALGGAALVYVGVRLWVSRDLVAWTVGGVAAACMFVGFILSRTTGLPSFHEAEWEPSGIGALFLEAAYLGAMGWWLSAPRRRARAAQEAIPPVPASVRDALSTGMDGAPRQRRAGGDQGIAA